MHRVPRKLQNIFEKLLMLSGELKAERSITMSERPPTRDEFVARLKEQPESKTAAGIARYLIMERNRIVEALTAFSTATEKEDRAAKERQVFRLLFGIILRFLTGPEPSNTEGLFKMLELTPEELAEQKRKREEADKEEVPWIRIPPA